MPGSGSVLLLLPPETSYKRFFKTWLRGAMLIADSTTYSDARSWAAGAVNSIASLTTLPAGLSNSFLTFGAAQS